MQKICVLFYSYFFFKAKIAATWNYWFYLWTRNLLFSLYLFTFYVAPIIPITEPCNPSPCGPNSQCRVVNDHAVCSCLEDHIGSPPRCRPECVVSTDCNQDMTCINQKCKDPCPGTCGLNARCHVVNHNPICSCPPGQTGDPFVRCVKEKSKNYIFWKIFIYWL